MNMKTLRVTVIIIAVSVAVAMATLTLCRITRFKEGPLPIQKNVAVFF